MALALAVIAIVVISLIVMIVMIAPFMMAAIPPLMALDHIICIYLMVERTDSAGIEAAGEPHRQIHVRRGMLASRTEVPFAGWSQID